MDSVHLFDTVVLILHRTNADVEKYIEVSLSEGLRVELCLREVAESVGAGGCRENGKSDENVKTAVEKMLPKWLCERMSDSDGDSDSDWADGLLVITDDDLTARELEKMGVAVAGYRAPGYEYMGFSTRYVVEELPMVDDEYFNLIYMRARHIPVVIAQTERTMIREMTEADLPAMYELYADPAVAKWCEPLYEYDKELEFTRAYIENMYTFYGYGLWLVFDRENGELIGRAGISNREIDGSECHELGYIIKGTRQRQGLGYEVGSAIMEYATDSLGMDELWLCVEKENAASIALGKKLGFKLWGSNVTDMGCEGEKIYYLYKKSPI